MFVFYYASLTWVFGFFIFKIHFPLLLFWSLFYVSFFLNFMYLRLVVKTKRHFFRQLWKDTWHTDFHLPFLPWKIEYTTSPNTAIQFNFNHGVFTLTFSLFIFGLFFPFDFGFLLWIFHFLIEVIFTRLFSFHSSVLLRLLLFSILSFFPF